MEKVVVVWSETVSREAVLEIPTAYDGSDQAHAHVENAVRQLHQGSPFGEYLDGLEIVDVQALRSGSMAEVG